MPNKVKPYKVIIQDPATEMLINHASFIALVSEAAAERLTAEFVKQAKTLKTMPERCPWFHDPLIPAHKYRKLIFGKYYILLFQIIDETVFVDAMLDCRKDDAWLLVDK
jgi:plasmid stabilization system protein ParE